MGDYCAENSKATAGIPGESSAAALPAWTKAIKELDIHLETLPRGLFTAYRAALRQLMRSEVAVPPLGDADLVRGSP